jgi:hypothetical protein
MRPVLVTALAFLAAGCGGGSTFGNDDVKRAFRDAGIALRPVPSNGAEQTGMGMTSGCPDHFVAATQGSVVNVVVCEDASAAADAGSGLRRVNVVVHFTGPDAVQSKIRRALDELG